MSNIPSFKTNSKPTLSKTEFDSHAKDMGKFVNEPGTYDMLIKAVSFKDTPSEKDSAWISAEILLETPDGKTMKHFALVPTECRNSFLFGADKSTFALENLQNFLRGLGVAFDFENGMAQVASIFGNVNNLIGKTLKVRVGYKGPTVKYLGKEEHVVVKSDFVTPAVDGVFKTKDAAIAAANEAGIAKSKLSYANVLEIFPSTTQQIVAASATTSVDLDLPF